jgi:peptidoglycan/xylan/chitin deacetylase (PgdA/CDA1 family)
MKSATLRVAKAIGIFAIARWITRRRLRILCYHGFSLRDEHLFRPGMFVTAATLESRLKHLQRSKYQVVSLQRALEDLRNNTLASSSVAITIDDGFYSTLSVAAPILERYKAPSTLYLTTYYVEHQLPIFNLALAYILYRSEKSIVEVSGLGLPSFVTSIAAGKAVQESTRQALAKIIVYANANLDRNGRSALLRAIAARADVDLDRLSNERLFGLVTDDEVRSLMKFGMTIELHTHRHWSPGTESLAVSEIEDNRRAIQQITGTQPTHFCYPSGRSDRWREEWLKVAGVQSATTCVSGLSGSTSNVFRLGRFLDGENIESIVFEAEMSGLLELLRIARRAIKGAQTETFADDPGEMRPEKGL